MREVCKIYVTENRMNGANVDMIVIREVFKFYIVFISYLRANSLIYRLL
jgi:hypothetical protein